MNRGQAKHIFVEWPAALAAFGQRYVRRPAAPDWQPATWWSLLGLVATVIAFAILGVAFDEPLAWLFALTMVSPHLLKAGSDLTVGWPKLSAALFLAFRLGELMLFAIFAVWVVTVIKFFGALANSGP